MQKYCISRYKDERIAESQRANMQGHGNILKIVGNSDSGDCPTAHVLVRSLA